MIFREATLSDIKQMQLVRNSVKENVLSNPSLVPDEAYAEFINGRGKGWVCEIDKTIVGFSFVDLKGKNIWALFVTPEFEKRGIGKQLHKLMLDWYFSQTKETAWLGTAPDTRAELFYEKSGWKKCGVMNKGEVKFEMGFAEWSLIKD